MGLYRKFVLPRLINLAMHNKELRPFRERVIGAAEGRVLEIGAGSGLNLQFYGPGASEVMALEPDPKLMAMARHHAAEATCPVKFLEASAEEIPLEDQSIDSVITTWTLCTIPDAGRALREMRRVLKPVGRLLFVEHGFAPEPGVQKWQDRLTPIWKRIGGGCHLNRPISALIERAGFRIDRLDTGYIHGPKPMTFMYEGAARPC
ncbi:MAG TPA: methyltransferase domain-containing protein [Rhizomicrobium sp.]|nr:methyltransferase domain-containing protein [Rhizomicrobium sp.]